MAIQTYVMWFPNVSMLELRFESDDEILFLIDLFPFILNRTVGRFIKQNVKYNLVSFLNKHQLYKYKSPNTERHIGNEILH